MPTSTNTRLRQPVTVSDDDQVDMNGSEKKSRPATSVLDCWATTYSKDVTSAALASLESPIRQHGSEAEGPRLTAASGVETPVSAPTAKKSERVRLIAANSLAIVEVHHRRLAEPTQQRDQRPVRYPAAAQTNFISRVTCGR